MYEIFTILKLITAGLPEIQRTLGQARWPAFANQLYSHAAAFQNLADESELSDAVNKLAGLFVDEAALFEIITRPDATTSPDGERQHPFHNNPPPITLKLNTVADSFFLLCQHPDLVAARVTLDKIAAQAGASIHPDTAMELAADRAAQTPR